MKKTCFRYTIASCVFGLLPATVQAQVDQPRTQVPGAQQPDRVPGRTTTPGQAVTPGQRSADSLQQPTDQQHESSRFASSNSSQGQSVQGFFVKKLMLGNRAEIELSQLATEKAQRDEVKQFAQKMIQDHQQMNQKLEQLQSGSASQPTSQGAAGSQSTPPRQQNGQPQPSQQGAHGQQGQQVPAQLMQVFEQAGEKHLQMTKQALQQQQGQDFDMAYLASQVGAHMHMLAMLQSMQNVGSQPFQQLVQQAEQKTSSHLEQAKSLAQKFEDDRKASNQGGQSRNAGDSSGNASGQLNDRAPANRTQPAGAGSSDRSN